MFVSNHLGTLGSLLIHFEQFLQHAPPEHLELLERILAEYENRVVGQSTDDAAFLALLAELLSTDAQLSEIERRPVC